MTAEQSWKKRAQRTAFKINLGWWLQIFSTPLLISSLCLACIILFMRRETDHSAWAHYSLITGSVIALTAITCWWIARRHFENTKQSLVRIEATMSLNNKLSAANEGITGWPDYPEKPAIVYDGTRWHWKKLIFPIITAISILTCALVIPIQAKSNKTSQAQPNAWNELESSIDKLEQQEIVQEEYLEEMRKKLEELREQSPEEWFSHSSLEATDNLMEQHEAEQSSLKNQLEQTENNLNSLQNKFGQLNSTQKERLLDEYDQALKNMQQGSMKPNEELLEQLKRIDPEQLHQLQGLNKEQIDQLRKKMRENSQQLDSDGNGSGEGESGEGSGDGDSSSESENNPDGPGGTGGVQRGSGHAPNPLGRLHQDTGAGKHEGLSSKDLSNSLPGDLLETSDSEHDVDKTKRGLTEGGDADSSGDGGNRVWKDSLLPAEKKALRQFFQ